MSAKLILSLGCAMLVGAMAASVEAQGLPRGPGKWWNSDTYKQELKLTTEQSAEIEQVFQQSMARLKIDKEELDAAEKVFGQLMAKPDVAEIEFVRAIDRVEMARYTMSKERTVMLVRIHRVLTPDQRVQMQAARKRDDALRNDADRKRPH